MRRIPLHELICYSRQELFDLHRHIAAQLALPELDAESRQASLANLRQIERVLSRFECVRVR